VQGVGLQEDERNDCILKFFTSCVVHTGLLTVIHEG
jgi:hypothetical protein